jgi:hypothetical protein
MAKKRMATTLVLDIKGKLEITQRYDGMLKGILRLNSGVMLHFWAFEIEDDDSDEGWNGGGDDEREAFSEWYATAGCEGKPSTMEIEGREYAVFMSPFDE